MIVLILAAVVLLLLTGSSFGSAVTTVATAIQVPETAKSGSTNTSNESGVNVRFSDSSLTGSEITNDVSTWPGSDKVYNICAAVALAEGYNIGVGTAPYDLNNPGDLSPGDEAGQPTAGGAQFHDGSSIVCFATAEGGWIALHTKFSNIVTGRSKVYPVTWTWKQVAAKYAGDSANWLNNVTNYLGVDPNSTPAQYVNL